MEENNSKQYKLAALEAATKSKCEKRKVGAVIVDKHGNIVSSGCNYSKDGKPCEDAQGATTANVVHAEVAAINNLRTSDVVFERPLTMFVTHAPCCECAVAIEALGIANVILVDTFMKFDTDKLRYDLVPAEWQKGDAEILTFGAKKYKPNNWKEVDDIGRYIAALERHLNDVKEAIETGQYYKLYDEETKLHHMKHLRTNAGFLLTLTERLYNEDRKHSESLSPSK